MKSTLRSALAALAVAALAAAPALAGTTYGKGVSKAAPVKITDLMAKPDAWVDKTVKVEGLVKDVCSKAGCWIEVQGEKDGDVMRVKVKDGEIVFPMEAKGKKVVAEGVFTKIVLTKEQAIEQAKHHAEETKTAFDPATITSGKTIYQIKGTGAVID